MTSALRPLRVGIVAGESSGDQLGAAFITALRARVPDAQFFGVAGPKMIAAGCEAWASAEELAVMGLTEVLHHLPRLLRLRASLVTRFLEARPDVFVGIDSPEFNLGLAKRLKRHGLRTVQYVSPQVWAWRQGRVRTIGGSCDLVLCLLPFETDFYAQHGVRAVFVGHPLADQVPLDVDRAAARRALGLEPTGSAPPSGSGQGGASGLAAAPARPGVPAHPAASAPAGACTPAAASPQPTPSVVALLPGSRLGEVERLGRDFVAGAAWIAARRPHIRFIAPMASRRVRELFEKKMAEVPGAPAIQILDGQAQRALAAADGVIVASGTATLEALLTGRPMVVAYRLGAATAFLIRTLGLVKVPYFSQPNLLVGRRLVPELFQEQVTGAALGEALLSKLEDEAYLTELRTEFRRVHETLRRGGADRAAAAVLECIGVSQPADAASAGADSARAAGADSARAAAADPARAAAADPARAAAADPARAAAADSARAADPAGAAAKRPRADADPTARDEGRS